MNWRDDSKLVLKRNCCLSSTFWNLFVYLFILFFLSWYFHVHFYEFHMDTVYNPKFAYILGLSVKSFERDPQLPPLLFNFSSCPAPFEFRSFLLFFLYIRSAIDASIDELRQACRSSSIRVTAVFFLFCFFLNQIKIKINKAGTQKRRNFQEMFWKISLTFSRVDFWQIML